MEGSPVSVPAELSTNNNNTDSHRMNLPKTKNIVLQSFFTGRRKYFPRFTGETADDDRRRNVKAEKKVVGLKIQHVTLLLAGSISQTRTPI